MTHPQGVPKGPGHRTIGWHDGSKSQRGFEGDGEVSLKARTFQASSEGRVRSLPLHRVAQVIVNMTSNVCLNLSFACPRPFRWLGILGAC